LGADALVMVSTAVLYLFGLIGWWMVVGGWWANEAQRTNNPDHRPQSTIYIPEQGDVL